MPANDPHPPTPHPRDPYVRRRRRHRRHQGAPLYIRQVSSSNYRRIRFSIHPDVPMALGFQDRHRMGIVFDQNPPWTRLGLRQTTDSHQPQFRDHAPSYGLFTVTFPTEDTADAFLPPGKLIYEPEIDLDPESGTLWFPLPHGRSAHVLRTYFADPWADLSGFIAGWARSALPGHPVVLVPGSVPATYDLRLHDSRNLSRILDVVRLDIPDELLQDPIRNGSPQKAHGFNPWNDDQKARIAAHLEQELSRLTDYYQREAATPSGLATPN